MNFGVTLKTFLLTPLKQNFANDSKHYQSESVFWETWLLLWTIVPKNSTLTETKVQTAARMTNFCSKNIKRRIWKEVQHPWRPFNKNITVQCTERNSVKKIGYFSVMKHFWTELYKAKIGLNMRNPYFHK